MSYIKNREAELQQQIELVKKNLLNLTKVPEHDIYVDDDVIFCRVMSHVSGDEHPYVFLKIANEWHHTGLIHHGFGGFTNKQFTSWDELLGWLLNGTRSIVEWTKMVRPYNVPAYEGPDTDLSTGLFDDVNSPRCTHGADCSVHPEVQGVHDKIVQNYATGCEGGCS